MKSVFDDITYVTFPHYKDNFGRVTLRTNIILMDNPMSDEEIGCTKIGTLDFWNDVSGWFHSNCKEHPVYSFQNASVEIPADIEVRHFNEHRGLVDGFTIGSVVVDPEYNLYVIHSFYAPRQSSYSRVHASGTSSIYFNYVNPDATEYLTEEISA